MDLGALAAKAKAKTSGSGITGGRGSGTRGPLDLTLGGSLTRASSSGAGAASGELNSPTEGPGYAGSYTRVGTLTLSDLRSEIEKQPQLSVEMSGKVREAEEKFGQALKEKRTVQSQLDQADIGTATLRAEVGAQEAEARRLARSACHAASEDSATSA